MKIYFRLVFFLICVTLAAAFMFGCGGKTGGENGTEKPEDEKPEEIVTSILDDPDFSDGFLLKGMNSATDPGVAKVIDYGDPSNVPKWGMAQWWSKFNLKDGAETITEDDYVLEDVSKKVTLKRKKGALSLGLKGSEEFESFNGVPPATWPHLLIEQGFREELYLKDADRIDVTLDFTLTKSENLRGGNLGHHAQFAWFIYIVDTNPASEGFGNFLWFGLNIFDSTKAYAPASAQQDLAGGPGNFIYTLGAQTFMPDRVRVNRNNGFTVDILPHIDAAIKSAQQKGFMTGTSLKDCSVTGTNIGWEVFDRWDVGITLFDIGIDFIKYKG